ncbi:MAG: FAD-binding oxidoreductase [Gammaproteobacteria bacterium]|nr:FAD-binding oxidoreductase [Gammaproteobacteria bacterium]
MIYSDASAINFQDPLPSAVDVVIIGAGIIGISTAWYLSNNGISVLVCDKGRVAGEQSSRNWGWIRQQGRDPAELPIAIDSINTWQSLSQDLDEDIGFTRQGVLFLATNESQLAQYENWLGHAAQHQLDTRMLTRNEVNTLFKDKPLDCVGGIYTPSDGRAEPFKAVPALARTVRKQGGLIRENCAVRSLDMQGGKIYGVVTESGRVRTSSVVCAGGAWANLFMANLGINLPQLTVRATVARTVPAENVFNGAASLGEVTIRRRQDGGYTVASSGTNEHYIGADSFRHMMKFMPALKASSRFIKLRLGGDIVTRLLPTRHWQDGEITPFEKTRILNPAPSKAAMAKMRKDLDIRLPKLASAPFAQAWAGMIDVMPDVVPVMDEVAEYPGFYLATGFSGHGFGIGPGAGRVMADMVMGKPSAHDLYRFRLSRFFDGTKMRPGPGL